ncbi:serine/threonine-protein kinase ULK3-like [Atheta coriaria]|uniref:serine/threonine-protein kinase ULK3-like n=1 Tax=Dalotia coriaria TaxID=877792 RepID=UPI0031F41022
MSFENWPRGFSSVFKLTKDVKGKHYEYAVKVLKFKERSLQEIKVLKTLKHENIVKYVDHFNNLHQIYLVMEYCDEGDLEAFILQRHKLAESLVKVIMQQLALATNYLHLHEICHMDIKPKNILVASKPRLTFKLSDFGIAEVITPEYMENCRDNGTIAYMAPEKLTGKAYDIRSDLWSLGVVMYQCLFGRPSYFNSSPSTVKNLMGKEVLLKIPVNSHISPVCEDLLTKLLTYNPNERINFVEFYNHAFIDLSNMPTNENYLYIIKIINDAVHLDTDKRYKNAVKKYEEAIALLLPYLQTETNQYQKEKMHAKYLQYTKRVQELHKLLKDNSGSQPKLPDFSRDVLMKMAASTPKMLTGLEIGGVAEQYLQEGKYALAFTKINEALDLLLGLCTNEPAGHRKTLLMAQIDKWLKLGEELKKFNGGV